MSSVAIEIVSGEDYLYAVDDTVFENEELFRFEGMDPKTIRYSVVAQIKSEGGWDKKTGKAIIAAATWIVTRGTTIKKQEKTSRQGIEKINAALTDLRITAENKNSSVKLTVARVQVCFPDIMAGVLLRLGPDASKISSSSQLKHWLKFASALSLVPQTDAVTITAAKAWLKDMDKQINAGKQTDDGRRESYESLSLRSPLFSDEQRKAILQKLEDDWASKGADFMAARAARREAAVQAQMKGVTGGAEFKETGVIAGKKMPVAGIVIDLKDHKKKTKDEVSASKDKWTQLFIIPEALKAENLDKFTTVSSVEELTSLYSAPPKKDVVSLHLSLLRANKDAINSVREGANFLTPFEASLLTSKKPAYGQYYVYAKNAV